jgi:hypothetical protein
MSLHVGEPGQPETSLDPTRQANARRVTELAVALELDVQTFEAHDALIGALQARCAALEATVRMLEALITGVAA